MIRPRARARMSRVAPALLVIAKAPSPGGSRPASRRPAPPAGGARSRGAALQDTLARRCAHAPRGRRVRRARRRARARGCRAASRSSPQRGDGLAERLAAAFADVGGPAFLVGMDTPQVTPALLDAGPRRASSDGDAAFGAALDGGYWGIGLRRPDPAVFARRADERGRHRRRPARAARARSACTTAILPPLRDVDTIADALRRRRRGARDTRFAAALATIDERAVA